MISLLDKAQTTYSSDQLSFTIYYQSKQGKNMAQQRFKAFIGDEKKSHDLALLELIFINLWLNLHTPGLI